MHCRLTGNEKAERLTILQFFNLLWSAKIIILKKFKKSKWHIIEGRIKKQGVVELTRKSSVFTRFSEKINCCHFLTLGGHDYIAKHFKRIGVSTTQLTAVESKWDCLSLKYQNNQPRGFENKYLQIEMLLRSDDSNNMHLYN